MTRISLASVGVKAIGIVVGLLAFALAQESVSSLRVSRETPSSLLEREMFKALDRLDVRSELETAAQNVDAASAEGYGTQLSRAWRPPLRSRAPTIAGADLERGLRCCTA